MGTEACEIKQRLSRYCQPTKAKDKAESSNAYERGMHKDRPQLILNSNSMQIDSNVSGSLSS